MSAQLDGPAELLGRLERLPFSKWHRSLLAVAFFGTLFDAADFALFGAALPPIAKEFGWNPAQSGLIATIGLVGAFAGALFWGTLSDYIGRRTAFQVTIGIFAACTGLIAMSWNTVSLAVFRFASNFGLGGEVPVASTLAAEFMPGRLRGRATGTMMAAFPTGLTLAALLALFVLPRWGWRVLFLIGVVPALVLLFVRRNVPESVRYLLSKGDTRQAEQTVSHIERAALGVAAPLAAPPEAHIARATVPAPASKVTVLELLAPPRLRQTLLLWIVSFCFLWASNGILFMLPTILTQRGLPLSQAIMLVLTQAVGGIFGYVACAFLIDRYGRRPILFLYFFVGAAFHLWFAMSTGAWMYVSIALVGWVNPGVFGPSTVYVGELYPTHLRATAVGWYFGIGRVGSFLAPAVVGLMLAQGLGPYVLYTFALSYLIAAVAIGLVGTETKGLMLEKITGLDVGTGAIAK